MSRVDQDKTYRAIKAAVYGKLAHRVGAGMPLPRLVGGVAPDF